MYRTSVLIGIGTALNWTRQRFIKTVPHFCFVIPFDYEVNFRHFWSVCYKLHFKKQILFLLIFLLKGNFLFLYCSSRCMAEICYCQLQNIVNSLHTSRLPVKHITHSLHLPDGGFCGFQPHSNIQVLGLGEEIRICITSPQGSDLQSITQTTQCWNEWTDNINCPSGGWVHMYSHMYTIHFI